MHRPYIFRRGQLSRFFFMGSLGSVSHGTLPDYLHRPYIFRRGQLSRFFFWVPWEVFHTVLCLSIYIVRTSFGGDSYRVFFCWVSWRVFHTVLCLILDSVWCTNRSQNLKKNIPGGSKCAQIHPKVGEKASRGDPGAARGHPWGPKGAPSKTEWKKGDNPPPPGHPKFTHFAE